MQPGSCKRDLGLRGAYQALDFRQSLHGLDETAVGVLAIGERRGKDSLC